MQYQISLSSEKTSIKLTVAQYLIGSRDHLMAVQNVGIEPNIFTESSKPRTRILQYERESPNNIKTSLRAKNTPAIPTELCNPSLHEKIVTALTQKPFELVFP